MMFPNAYRATQYEEEVFTPDVSNMMYLNAKLWDSLADTYVLSDTLRETEILYREGSRPRMSDREASMIGLPGADRVRRELRPPEGLTKEQFKASPNYRDGMEYQPGMTEARMAVNAEWRDAQDLRRDIIAAHDTGFVTGTLGFMAGIVGSIPDPTNLLTFGVGGTLTKKVGFGIAENIAAEAVGRLVTTRQREKAGIAPTTQEMLMQGAFAAVLGGIMPIAGVAMKAGYAKVKGKMSRGDVKVDADGNLKPTVEEQRINAIGLAENMTENLSQADKLKVMNAFAEVAEQVGELNIRPPEGGFDVADDANFMDLMQRYISKTFENDPELLNRVLDSTGIEIKQSYIDNSVSTKAELPPTNEPTVTEELADYLNLNEEKQMAVDDLNNLDIEGMGEDIKGGEKYLQGKTLFEVADRETEEFKKGLDEAYIIANERNCL